MLTRNGCSVFDSNRTRSLAMASVTWHRGRHAHKGGVDLQRTTYRQITDYNGGGVDIVAPDADGVITMIHVMDVFKTEDSTTRAELGGYYVQDELRFHPRVTANLGLRYSTYGMFNDLEENVWHNDIWEPRLGLAWDATGDAVNVFKASGCPGSGWRLRSSLCSTRTRRAW